MSYTIVYDRFEVERFIENLTLENIGTFFLQKKTHNGMKNWLMVQTRDALSCGMIIKGQKYTNLKVKLFIAKFNQTKIISMIKTFLGGSLEEIQHLTKEEFIEELKNLGKIYINLVDFESKFVL